MSESQAQFPLEISTIKPEEGFYAKYVPDKILGYGFTSVVRKCIDQLTRQIFAVKIIERTSIKELEVRNEVTTLRKLGEDPNVISLIDFFENENHFFLVFELAEGGELYDYLNKQITLNEQSACGMMFDIIRVVSHMHQLGIVHRDLKLENILLGADLHVLISDFGFAIQLKENELLRDLCGTPDYLAPEVLRCSIDDHAKGYGLAVDMWACGVIGYLLLAGFPPFWHRKQNVMIWNIMDGKYTLTGPEWSRVSNEAKDLISKLLVVDPDKRLTALNALQHSWFNQIRIGHKKRPKTRISFSTLVCAIMTIRAFYNIYVQKISILKTGFTVKNPYSSSRFRKIIDTCAFSIYGHWIKRSSNQHQNRAALYENKPKSDLCDEEQCILSKPYQYRLSFSDHIKKRIKIV